MTLTELIRDLDDVDVHGDGDIAITGITHDSRQVGPGSLFVALPGARFDGRRFIPNAIGAGAAAVAVPADSAVVHDLPTLLLKRPRRNLAELSARFNGHPSRSIRMVGLTGTNGKTTVASILSEMMAAEGLKPGMIGTLGEQTGQRWREGIFTTPEAPDLHAMLARMVEAGVVIVAMEVSSVGLAEERVHGIDFNVAAFLNLTPDHLDYHGTMADYGAAKKKLFTSHLADDARVIINIDDPFGAQLAVDLAERRPNLSILTVAIDSQEAHYAYDELVCSVEGIQGLLRCPDGHTLPIQSHLLGRYNAANLAVASAIGHQLNFDASAIVSGALSTRVRGRLERVEGCGDIDVFVDYAHTADALRRTIQTLKVFTNGRLWCVFGCGGDRDVEKRAPMGRASAQADVVIITSDNPRTEAPMAIAKVILDGCLEGGLIESTAPQAGHVCVRIEREDAIATALSNASAGDIVLIAGKGHETYQEVDGHRRPFDDAAIARRCWAELAS
ncbi:MAG: UDP-N-acetylmuramoyl-L-alanyl-D-glutamate--2,6-diaminopimelate ligase [Myxococcota bacterium]|nr:UDP-N-acetylmuramoyl-L-alanyl-D-glutamate--2,6-diaminopimelate ligase [Myxococcota bacterium]